jgi:hypothetical protein
LKADLKECVQGEFAKSLVYISNPEIQGLLRLDRDGESGMLVVYSTIRKGSGQVRDKRARTEVAVQMVRDAIGIDDLEVELVAGEDWTAKSEYSKGIYCKSLTHELDLQKGRIFLAGDAAQRMAPTGICNSDQSNEKAGSQAIRGFKMCTTCPGSYPWSLDQMHLLPFSIPTISSVMLSVW